MVLPRQPRRNSSRRARLQLLLASPISWSAPACRAAISIRSPRPAPSRRSPALVTSRAGACSARSSTALATLPHKKSVRGAGLVTGRQRPGTATGVIFITLEDEFGTVNVVVWSDLAERQRAEVLDGRLLGVIGVIVKAEGVIHLIATGLEDHSALLGRLATTSRDFH